MGSVQSSGRFVNAHRNTGRPPAFSLNGTACNANTGPTGERRLGEYVTVALDPAGRLIAATSDTMLTNQERKPAIAAAVVDAARAIRK